MELTEDAYLAHYGILRKSGRYPWGSGENSHQRSREFFDVINDLKAKGMSDAQIAKSFHDPPNYPFTTQDLRAIRSRAGNVLKQEQIRTAIDLKEQGLNPSQIGREMGINESTVRSYLEPGRLERLDVLQQTAEMLKQQVAEKKFVDVGAKTELDLPIGDGPNIGISKDKFDTALSMLKEEGYSVHPVHIPQAGTGKMTRYRVLVGPGVTAKEAFANRDKIQQISHKMKDDGSGWTTIQPPLNISSKRVGIRYAEDGGTEADGVIYVRPGVKDVSLGKATYAQVRIAVDGTHYLKGMAVYKDDLPDGVDLLFNTNKSDTGNKLAAMKEMKKDDNGKIDPNNPFGAAIKVGGQILDPKTNKPSSVMNILNEEGDWDKWSNTLSRQMLSKQKPELAKKQLDLTHKRRVEQFEELKSLTNPLVKRQLLEDFANETDSAAVHLKAADMHGQAMKVLLPSSKVKPNEIFAPTYRDGDRVVLVRFPHAGTFEIPELTVNNRNRDARNLLRIGKGGTAPDAVVIHHKVAEQLSGADFDGDHVVVIPNNRREITKTHPLEKLKGYDPKKEYAPYDGMKTIDGGVWSAKEAKPIYPPRADGKPGKPKKQSMQQQMGNITNLISDMTVKGADTDKIARAVKHSMTVIDAEKHSLDVKRSYKENGILALKKEYQGTNQRGQPKGAQTLITRAEADTYVNRFKDAPAQKGKVVRIGQSSIDVATGKRVYVDTGDRNRNGDLIKVKAKKLAVTDNAFDLVSDHGGTEIERVYAAHSNRLKALANDARKEMISAKPEKANPAAKKTYATEVESLTSKLRIAEKNAPLERQAQVWTDAMLRQRRQANPDMDKADEKKIRGQLLTEARARMGSRKTQIEITPKEWDAIQAGAISIDRLERILKNAKPELVREYATPKRSKQMSSVLTARAQRMIASGATLQEVSEALGIPPSTIQDHVSGEVK